MGIFNPDNFLNKFLSKTGDIILLNFLFLICSIPLFTIGASAAALYYSCLRIIKGGESSPRRDFFNSMKQNFKQATLIWLVFALLAIVLVWNLQFLSALHTTASVILKYASYGIAALLALELLYIFPVVAAFENTTKNLLKNAFLFTYMHIPSTILMFFLWMIPLSLTFTDFQLLPLYVFCWFFFGFGLLAFICSWLFYRIFKKYLPEEDLPLAE